MMDELDTRLTIAVTRLDPEGEMLEGEVDCIDLNETYVKPFGGIRYRLNAQVFGTELLVRGHLEQDFTLVCSRCGEDFDTTIADDDFTTSIQIDEKTEEVDLTNEVRECIILALPTYPVCDETCPGIEQKTAMPADDRWNVLDNLKKGEKKNG